MIKRKKVEVKVEEPKAVKMSKEELMAANPKLRVR